MPVQGFNASILEKIDVQRERVLPRYAANHRNLTTNQGGRNYAKLHKHFRRSVKHSHIALFIVEKAIDPI